MGKRGMSPSQAAKVWTPTTKLQGLRVKKGLSQNDLAMKSGVPKGTIQRYEHQTRAIDSARLSVLCNLAETLDCNIEDILEDDVLIKKFRSVK